MAGEPNIGPREREVLTQIIEAYIVSGEPVGSRTLSRGNSEGLSPASIRNVMSDLTEAGYLEQPHTSAGRIPTAVAFRYYVDQISSGVRISDRNQVAIESQLSGVNDLQDFLERTSHVLSVISQNIGVAVAGGPKEVLEHIHFSRLAENRVLAVLITKAGVVRDRVLRLKSELTQGDLELAGAYLNENFRGWTLEALRAEVERRLEQARSEYDRLMNSIEALYREGALTAESAGHDVYLEGAANLLGSGSNQERLRELLRSLEAKQKVAELLGAYLDSQQQSVRVVFGLEDLQPHLKDFVLIGAPAKIEGETVGSLAVIGPLRIDYQDAIAAVSYVSKLLEKILKES
ncbi:MAG TPA: heat-inducible transcriptional repressor HrcA [Terriglobales bacterium]|nr:heat-inducible transcriptional repressor HrcA [Terriglobales bacterium]